ncbi:MAG: fibronectin type III domain-containing protein [Thermoanaerobaculia bacterium]
MKKGFSNTLPGPQIVPSSWFLRQTGTGRALALMCLAIFSAGISFADEQTSEQLSDGHTFSAVDFTSTRPLLSPNGLYVVYRQDAVADGVSELYSVRVDGTTPPQRLCNVFSSSHFLTFAISPNSQRVVYMVDQDIAGRTELYSIPIGGGTITKLNDSLSSARNVISFQISPTSSRVFYVSDQFVNDQYELYSVPITGGTALRINHNLDSDWDVETSFRIAANGSFVVYRAVRTALGSGKIYYAPATTTNPDDETILLNLSLENFSAVDAYFQISPSGTRVVYLADAIVDERKELYSVNIPTVAVPALVSIKLNVGVTTIESGFLISGDSSRVVFRADPSGTSTDNLYSVPITGGTVAQLNGTLGAGKDVNAGFQITPNSSRVVYISDEGINDDFDVFSVPISGGPPTRLNPTLTSGGDILDFAISPDSSRVVYRGDRQIDTLVELYSVALAGGPEVKINRPLAAGGDVVSYRISPDSTKVVYGADQDLDSVDELLAASILGGAPGDVQNISGPLTAFGDVVLCPPANCTAPNIVPAFEIASNNVDVVYVADELVNDEIEIFRSGLAIAAAAPGAPTGVTATAGNTQAIVTFATPVNDGGDPITGYFVISNPTGGVDSAAGTTALTHTVTNLTNGTPYTFTVKAANSIGLGAASVASPSVTPGTVAGPPTAVSAVPRNLSAEVQFSAPTNNGGVPITGYTVVSSPAGGVDSSAGSTSLVHIVQQLTNGTPYTFTVTAANAFGSGAPSAASSAVTPGCGGDVPANVFCDGVESGDSLGWSLTHNPPSPPTNVVAVAGDTDAMVTFLPPIDDGGSAITGYTVTASVGAAVDEDAGTTSLSHHMTSLTNDSKVQFRVTATTNFGTSVPSDPSTPVIPHVP